MKIAFTSTASATILINLLFSLSAGLYVTTAYGQSTAADIARSNPAPCLDKAVPYLVRQVQDEAAMAFIGNVGKETGANDAWKPGNLHFDRAVRAFGKAAAADQLKFGPWLSINAAGYLETLFQRAPANEQEYLAAFYKTPEGRLYWKSLIDGGYCNGLINAVKRDPLLSEKQRRELDAAKASFDAMRTRFAREYAALNPSQRAAFGDGDKILKRLLKMEAAGESPFNLSKNPKAEDQLQTSATRIVKAARPAITAALKDFMKSQAKP